MTRATLEEERWRQLFDAIAEELCSALQRGDVISRLVQEEIETPAGPESYGGVLTMFESSADNGRRKLAQYLLRIIAQERLSIREALAALDAADMPQA
jgi:hypothetical protein